jgi:hypothetical protein
MVRLERGATGLVPSGLKADRAHRGRRTIRVILAEACARTRRLAARGIKGRVFLR